MPTKKKSVSAEHPFVGKKAPDFTASAVMPNNEIDDKFNLHFYLNNTCKDAMNITDFVRSIEFTNEMFERTGRIGYIEGISAAIIENLQKLKREQYPFHCTDAKRDVIYIKDNDVWEKDENNKIITWSINRVGDKNLYQNLAWRQAHPDCEINNTESNLAFTEIMVKAFNGKSAEEAAKNNKVIVKNIVRVITIDKKNAMMSS